jgi:hypothetical protein
MRSFSRVARRNATRAGSLAALVVIVGLSGAEGNAQTTELRPVDKASVAGLNAFIRSFDIVSGDWDADDYDDLLVIPHDPDALREGVADTSVPLFYQSSGDGTFSEMPHGFAGRDRHACAFDDMDVDGRLDFFCTEGFSSTRGKELGIQQPDGSFVDAAESRGFYVPSGGRYRGVALFDANNDMYPDVYLTRYYGPNRWDGVLRPAEDPPRPNEFWLSHGGSQYTQEPSFGLDQPIGAPKDSSSCAQGVDYDDDGYEDLLVCGYKALYLYHNEGGVSFTDVTAAMGLAGYAIDARLVDLDGDGDLDLVRTKGNYFAARLWNGTTWNATGYTLSKFGRGGQDLGVGDFDGDGDQDVYLVRNCIDGLDRPDIILLNDGSGRFTRRDLPALPAGGGCGQAVAATDYDNDGLTDFAVANGHKKKYGPIQLWSYKAF